MHKVIVSIFEQLFRQKGFTMALSDLLLQLGTQAKNLELSATVIRDKQNPGREARVEELKHSLTDIKATLATMANADAEAATSRLAGLQRTVSDHFDALRIDATTNAQSAAEGAIDFALHAVQEAEYYVLAATAPGDNEDIDVAIVTDDPEPAAATRTPPSATKAPNSLAHDLVPKSSAAATSAKKATAVHDSVKPAATRKASKQNHAAPAPVDNPSE